MLLLLVDDDKAEILKGSKHRRTGTHGYFSLSPLHPFPFVKPFSEGKPTVENRNTVAESSFKNRQQLRGKGYFGYHNDYIFFIFQGLVDEL